MSEQQTAGAGLAGGAGMGGKREVGVDAESVHSPPPLMAHERQAVATMGSWRDI